MYLVLSIALFACGSDDELDDPNNDNAPTEKEVTLKDIEGVWTKNDYFISFNAEKYCASFVANGFIDSGSFIFENETAIVHNNYFNRDHSYTIKSVKDDKMEVSVNYTDFRGDKKTASLTLSKTAEKPISKENPLIGKSYSARSQYFGTVTTSFITSCSGKKMASSGNARKYPLNVYYVYRDGTFYQQLYTDKNHQVPSIGAWTTNADDGNIIRQKITFADNGSIESVETIQKFE